MSELKAVQGPYTRKPKTKTVVCGGLSWGIKSSGPQAACVNTRQANHDAEIATADLMAASWEMYAELQKQLTHWEVIWGGSLDRDLAKHAKQEALHIRALLAKARGESK